MTNNIDDIATQKSNVVAYSVETTKQWINWQLNQFFSLATEISDTNSQSKYCGGQRHWWTSLADYWLNKPISEAEDDIIVRLAADKALFQSLQEIAKNPTSQLISIRKRIQTGKPLEMDAICLRDLEQKPGNCLFEKASSSTRILSLHRTHSHATLENKIFIYVINVLFERAKRYCKDNERFKNNRVVQDVKNFLLHLGEMTSHASHFHCAELRPSLSITPNNCLLYDRYYNVVWITYRRLLLLDRATQDAWQFQHILWKETGRQIIGSILSSRLPNCKSIAGSCAYIKRDMQMGRWTEHCSFPGPFQWHRYHLSVMDAWDSEFGSNGNGILESLDADQLFVGSLAGKPQKHIVIWYHHQPFEEVSDIDCLMKCYSERLKVISNSRKSNYSGLIIGSAPSGAPLVYMQSGTVIYLNIPADFPIHQERMVSSIQRALESFLEKP